MGPPLSERLISYGVSAFAALGGACATWRALSAMATGTAVSMLSGAVRYERDRAPLRYYTVVLDELWFGVGGLLIGWWAVRGFPPAEGIKLFGLLMAPLGPKHLWWAVKSTFTGKTDYTNRFGFEHRVDNFREPERAAVAFLSDVGYGAAWTAMSWFLLTFPFSAH